MGGWKQFVRFVENSTFAYQLMCHDRDLKESGLRRTLARFMTRGIRISFYVWKEHAHVSEHVKEILCRFGSKSRLLKLAKYFQRWQWLRIPLSTADILRRCKNMLYCLLCIIKFQLAAAVHKWKVLATQRRREQFAREQQTGIEEQRIRRVFQLQHNIMYLWQARTPARLQRAIDVWYSFAVDRLKLLNAQRTAACQWMRYRKMCTSCAFDIWYKHANTMPVQQCSFHPYEDLDQGPWHRNPIPVQQSSFVEEDQDWQRNEQTKQRINSLSKKMSALHDQSQVIQEALQKEAFHLAQLQATDNKNGSAVLLSATAAVAEIPSHCSMPPHPSQLHLQAAHVEQL